jgi:2-keto-4-pentenoate hydratase/2-oxohepta-3-ene-1,7-dioic acid hydratase in catechol pathway
MQFDLAYLIAFHSQVFTWEPGDILSPGTPGAGVIQTGDVVEAHVADLPPLRQIVH